MIFGYAPIARCKDLNLELQTAGRGFDRGRREPENGKIEAITAGHNLPNVICVTLGTPAEAEIAR